MKPIKLITVLSILVLVAACVSNDYKVDPAAMQTKGLLIGTLVKRDSSFQETEIPLSIYGVANAKINGQLHKNAVRGGKIMVQLPPGDYQLESISKSSESTGSLGLGVELTTYSRVAHPIKAAFSIKQGQVTNLGAIVVAYEDEGRVLKSQFVDNSKDARTLLKRQYPKLYQSLSRERFALADEHYLSDAELFDLRKQMVLALPKSRLGGAYATADLGTIAKLGRNRKGELLGVDIIETGTLNNIWNCATFNHRFACVIDAEQGRLLIQEGRELVERTINPLASIVRLFLADQSTVVLVTEKMHILTSTNNAKSWHTYSDFVWDKPLKPNTFLPPAYLRSYDLRFNLGRKGYYLYPRRGDKALFYWSYGSTQPTKIPFPEKEDELQGLVETAKGLYTKPALTLLANGTAHFLANGSNQWREISIPSGSCSDLKVLDYERDKIAARCSVIMISSDSAKTWRQGSVSDLK